MGFTVVGDPFRFCIQLAIDVTEPIPLKDQARRPGPRLARLLAAIDVVSLLDERQEFDGPRLGGAEWLANWMVLAALFLSPLVKGSKH